MTRFGYRVDLIRERYVRVNDEAIEDCEQIGVYTSLLLFIIIIIRSGQFLG